jgi:HPt (histidine-containing phosphotransfer) domain-containing protein
MQLSQNSNLPPVKLYDLHLISQLCRGNEEQIAKIVEVFTEEVSKSIEEINIAYAENDFSEIKKLVHKVKPTLAYFGTAVLEKEFLYLEDLLIKEFELSELELKIISVNNLTKEVVDKLKSDYKIIN